MVAHLISLRFRLMIAGWKRSTFVLVMTLLGVLYALGVLFALFAGMVALGWSETELRGTVVVLLGAAIVLAWLIVPLFASGMDQSMEPRNFATFGLPTPTLIAGLGVGALVTTTGALTLLASLTTVLVWRDSALVMLISVLGALLATVFCICLGHGVTGILSAITGRRRVRETLSLIAFIPLMLAGVIFGTAVESIPDLVDQLPGVAAALLWTPLGSFTGAAWSASNGALGTAVAQLGLSLVWVLAAVGLWMVAVRRSIDRAPNAGSSSRSTRGTGLLGRFPATPAGAIAARSIIYWIKDPRYSASLITVPLMVVVLLFLGGQSGSPVVALMLGPLVGLLLGFSIQADLSYDGAALSMHVTTGVSGADDRRGRVAALLLWAFPATLSATLIGAAVTGSWSLLPGAVGLGIALLFGGAGLSALISARFVYPVPAPGASPFATPQGSMMRTAVVQMVSLLATLAVTLPAVVLTVVALVNGELMWNLLALAVGLLNGLVVLWIGVRMGAGWYDRTSDKTYQQVLRYVSSQ
ncbi:MAG: hypothetical protein ACTHZ5_07605 [Micrococcaceae bacterium]